MRTFLTSLARNPHPVYKSRRTLTKVFTSRTSPMSLSKVCPKLKKPFTLDWKTARQERPRWTKTAADLIQYSPFSSNELMTAPTATKSSGWVSLIWWTWLGRKGKVRHMLRGRDSKKLKKLTCLYQPLVMWYQHWWTVNLHTSPTETLSLLVFFRILSVVTQKQWW